MKRIGICSFKRYLIGIVIPVLHGYMSKLTVKDAEAEIAFQALSWRGRVSELSSLANAL